MSVLVVGGTGRVGREVVNGLVQKGQFVAVLTRSAEKLVSLGKGVDGRLGDASLPQTLPGAMQGADRLILITAHSQREIEEGIAVVNAAKQAGVQKIAFLSVFHAEIGPLVPSFRSKIEIQKAIVASGIPSTILMANNFYQNDFLFERPLLDYGVYPFPLGEVGLNRVDIRDIADAFVHAVTEEGHAGKKYPLIGPDVWTGKKIAQLYSQHLGKQVRYGGNNLGAWAEQAKTTMPAWMIGDLKLMFEFIQLRGMIATQEDFQLQNQILKHPPRSYESFVQETISIWRSAEG